MIIITTNDEGTFYHIGSSTTRRAACNILESLKHKLYRLETMVFFRARVMLPTVTRKYAFIRHARTPEDDITENVYYIIRTV